MINIFMYPNTISNNMNNKYNEFMKETNNERS